MCVCIYVYIYIYTYTRTHTVNDFIFPLHGRIVQLNICFAFIKVGQHAVNIINTQHVEILGNFGWISCTFQFERLKRKSDQF